MKLETPGTVVLATFMKLRVCEFTDGIGCTISPFACVFSPALSLGRDLAAKGLEIFHQEIPFWK